MASSKATAGGGSGKNNNSKEPSRRTLRSTVAIRGSRQFSADAVERTKSKEPMGHREIMKGLFLDGHEESHP
jgi:hypothetical protein